MDILIFIKRLYINFIYALPDSLVSYILRISILLILSITLLSLSWRMPHRSIFLQFFIFFLAISLALHIPLERVFELSAWQRSFLFTTSFLCMVFLPSRLPFLLVPRVGTQIKLEKFILIVIWGLFLLQLILAR